MNRARPTAQVSSLAIRLDVHADVEMSGVAGERFQDPNPISAV